MRTRRPTHRLVRLILLVAVCGACALASAALAGSASAVIPPPGTPDLSQMVLAPSDFASGARITKQGYVRDKSFIANYERNFASSCVVLGAALATSGASCLSSAAISCPSVTTRLASERNANRAA